MRNINHDLLSITHRTDYTPPAYWIDTVQISMDLDPILTRVSTRMTVRHNPESTYRDLVLDGESLTLIQVSVNGSQLAPESYRHEATILTIFDMPDEAMVEIETQINPSENTSLMGLYVSNGNLFTQCEAEGFRKITFFPDRPDVMAKYTVMLRADRKIYPILLSNGNLTKQGDLSDGLHYAQWDDPFKKPSYLFALVAGKLICRQEKINLRSGRKVALQVWVERENMNKTQHAMDSLKKSIRWDEERFGLELDLDRFMIVAVSDFNMGAMENKGLNIFNTKYVLADPETATDVDYANIESVVAHEYFHNWTGNRVTCRDWFQLSLKEGLTVFRDQEFSADMMGTESGRGVKRIEDVRVLRQLQFSEDAGPMAHPVRPDSYSEISNFYTVTVYEKGAEVVRLFQTLLGREGFRRGMDLYFARHDGQAVQCDDFRRAMADANGRDLEQFERWYSQAGTPRVRAEREYDDKNKTWTLTLTQSCPATPDQPVKQPFHILITMGLLNRQGQELPLQLAGEPGPSGQITRVLELTQATQSFQFVGVPECPIPSLLRNFSAPVILEDSASDQDLVHLLTYDTDSFNRWEAGQRLMMRRLVQCAERTEHSELKLDTLFVEALRHILREPDLDPAFKDLVLTLPSELMIAERMATVNPQAIHLARQAMRTALTQALEGDFFSTYAANATIGPYSPDALSSGKRRLKNTALAYLVESYPESTRPLALMQYEKAKCMTDRIAALTALIHEEKSSMSFYVLKNFYSKFKREPLVIDKWFAIQAMARTTNVKAIRILMQHKKFTWTNPNRVRSVIFSFCNGNPAQFHARDGSGYALWAESVITLDSLNPQVAARLARSLDRWREFIPELKEKMHQALLSVAAHEKLSKDVREIIVKSLEGIS